MGFTAATVGGKVTATMYNQHASGVRFYKAASAAVRTAISDAVLGDLCFQSDTGWTYRYNGSVWRVWEVPTTLYTPTVTNGVRSSGDLVYWVAAGVVHVQGIVTLSSVSGNLQLSAPSGLPLSEVNISIIGECGFEDVGTGTFLGVCAPLSSTSLALYLNAASGSFASLSFSTSATVPFTWVSGDRISLSARYPTSA